jgi:DNA-binding SARP family transcriptional activator
MRFRLLGPATVNVAGRSLALPSGRLRAVLALLALNPGRIVPVERIIDGVWGEAPPASVRTQVHAQVSASRRVLAAVEGVHVHTRPGGYVLAVSPRDVDVFVFEEWITQARALTVANRVPAAADVLRAALALWQGPALAGVDAPFARLEAARLEEQRLAALVERVALDLRLGRHHALVPELTALVAEHPLWETLRRHLMIALSGTGRRAEALRAFDEGRRLLRDELGLDPGPELAAAHRAIVRHPLRRRPTAGHDDRRADLVRGR